MISLTKAAKRLGICAGSAKSLVLKGVLPATQILPSTPWLVPVEALLDISPDRSAARDRTTTEDIR